jgi:hypothetical protein
VTHLRKMMLEELQRRNYAETTIDCYIRAVEDFSRHFNCSPDRLGLRHIREYQGGWPRLCIILNLWVAGRPPTTKFRSKAGLTPI